MKGRHILVSGSTSGIGRATTELLLSSGAKVTGIARNHEQFQPNDENYNTVALNLGDLSNITSTITEIMTSSPDIDGLVNCAGFGKFGSLENFSSEQIQAYINVNLISHLIVTRSVISQFKSSEMGDIIFMGSEAALKGSQMGSLYCTVKFGIRGFAQSIRQESADKNIRVTIINPGMVRTEFFNNLKFRPGDDDKNAIEPSDVAKSILTVLSMRQGTVIDEINLTPQKKVIKFD